MKEEHLIQTLNSSTQNFYGPFTSSMKSISGHGIYFISLSISSSSRLGFIMNDTTRTSDNGFPQCIVLFRTNDTNVKNITLTIIYGTLIPSIIGVNLLLIVGITKTKRNKFTSSQILFLTLFLNDLTFGVVQLPIQVYLLWKPREPI